MRKLLRTRAPVGDRDLIVITDEDVTVNPDLTLEESLMVIGVLANKVRAFYVAADGTPSALAAEIVRLQEANETLQDELRDATKPKPPKGKKD